MNGLVEFFNIVADLRRKFILLSAKNRTRVESSRNRVHATLDESSDNEDLIEADTDIGDVESSETEEFVIDPLLKSQLLTSHPTNYKYTISDNCHCYLQGLLWSMVSITLYSSFLQELYSTGICPDWSFTYFPRGPISIIDLSEYINQPNIPTPITPKSYCEPIKAQFCKIVLIPNYGQFRELIPISQLPMFDKFQEFLRKELQNENAGSLLTSPLMRALDKTVLHMQQIEIIEQGLKSILKLEPSNKPSINCKSDEFNSYIIIYSKNRHNVVVSEQINWNTGLKHQINLPVINVNIHF